jgi:thioredoxin-like negative regulator of GroEL
MALGFAALLNLAVMSTLVWTELLAAGVRNSVWMVVAALWAGSALLSYRRDVRCVSQSESSPAQQRFAEALSRYVARDWFEAERGLRRLLAEDPRDSDAGLMLAALLRRTGRTREAERQLDRIERFDGSRKWELEIRRERELLRSDFVESPQEPAVGAQAATPAPPAERADAA